MVCDGVSLDLFGACWLWLFLNVNLDLSVAPLSLKLQEGFY